MTMQVIERLQQHIDNLDPVHPGQPAQFTAACQPGDGIWQGDLGLEIIDNACVPAGYVLIENPTAAHMQLVPGNTQGARHCLDSLDGVQIYWPPAFGKDDAALNGPCLVLTEERKVLHPTHGTVTLLPGTTILCRYQREWDKEQQRARRQQD